MWLQASYFNPVSLPALIYRVYNTGLPLLNTFKLNWCFSNALGHSESYPVKVKFRAAHAE